MPRDEFTASTKHIVAHRAGLHCSNPQCQTITSGPTADPHRALSIGEAAHISGASPGGPRFDSSLTPVDRASPENAIWLCRSCAALIDRDEARFTTQLLKSWKDQVERQASKAIAGGTGFRPIAPSELRQELSLPEAAALRAIEDEFQCHVELNASVLAGKGWLNLAGAVVRSETLVGVEIYENKGSGIPYFQIEYLFELIPTLRFPRFHNFELYLAVVSDCTEEADAEAFIRLNALAAKSPFPLHIRTYRLNALRARFGL